MILTVTLNAAIDKRYVVEDFKIGEVNRVKECVYTPGGKGLNVSKPASIAGANVVATGFVGGHAGNYIEAELKPFGIESAFYHMNEESRSCINIWDTVNKKQTEFLELIKDMYANLENQEWFSAMPLAVEDLRGMMDKPRFYIIGAYENNELCGVSSIDYKCGKLVGKVDFPKCCNTDKMVEIAFNMVHSKARGKGLMSKMVDFLLKKLKQDGFTCAFAKVNKDNFIYVAIYISLVNSFSIMFCGTKAGIESNTIKPISSASCNSKINSKICSPDKPSGLK